MIKSGLLWDLEHFTAWITGLAIGPWLARPARQATTANGGGRPTDPAQTRILSAVIVAGLAISKGHLGIDG